MRFIDPDGMWGDYYNQDGKKVGTDGNNDGKKYLVTDNSQARSIARTTKSGGTTQVGDVSSAVLLPSNAALKESLNVLKETVDGGGLKEHSSLVMTGGSVIEGSEGGQPKIQTDANGNSTSTAPSTLPSLPSDCISADVEATIHSHPTDIQVDGNTAYPHSATIPSSQDGTTLSKYSTNIIVGPLGQGSVSRSADGTLITSQTPLGAVIYNNNMQPQVQLTQKAIQKIVQ